MSLKCAASGDCFSKRNLWSGSHNTKTLTSDLPLESHLTSVYKRRRVCSASISSQSCMNRRELRACTLMWLIILITSCKTSLSSGDIFSDSQHFSMDDTVCRLTFRSDLFDPSNETRKPSSHGNLSVRAYTSTE